MKKYLSVICLLAFLCAQESIGFSNPDQISILKEFTMPTFEFTRISFGSSGGTRNNTYYNRISLGNNDYASSTTKNNNNDIDLNVKLRYEYDSDNLYYDVYFYGQLRNQFDGGTNSSYNRNTTSYRVNLFAKYYPNETLTFVTGAITLYENFEDIAIKNLASISDEKRDLENLNTNYSLGIGFGKVRNVNHVIRAIRFSERLEAIGQVALTDQEIIAVAEEIGKLGAITNTFSRYKREIWKNIFSVISSDLSSVELHQVFYLDEIFDEVIGSRLEGYEMSFSYSQLFNRSKYRSSITSNITSNNRNEMLRFSSSYYYNLSLKNQFHVTFNYYLEIPKWHFEEFSAATITPSIGYLYNVTDRVIFESGISYSKNSMSHYSLNRDNEVLISNTKLTYFIENTLSAGIEFKYEDLMSELSSSRINRSLTFGINYSIINSYR